MFIYQVFHKDIVMYTSNELNTLKDIQGAAEIVE